MQALKRFPEIEEAVMFGSRAMGHAKKGSDVDMAVKGSKVTPETLLRLKSFLDEELPLPYLFDLVHYESIQNPEFKTHIDSFGKKIYGSK